MNRYKQMLPKLFMTFLLIAQASVCVIIPREAQAQEEKGEESQFNVEITEDCFGEPEDGDIGEPPDAWPPGDYVFEYPPFIPSFTKHPTRSLAWLDWSANNWLEFLNSMGFLQSENMDPPMVRIQSPSNGLMEGDPIVLIAQPENFKNEIELLHFSWWHIQKDPADPDKEIQYSLNGLLAGGSDFTDRPIDSGTRCGRMTRNRGNDTDGDGMDDVWERRFKDDIYALNPFEDPDDDGYNAYVYLNNSSGDPLQIVPNTQANIGTPPVRFSTGDGWFPTLEEYIWGTNPLDADSDDDGYIDEADVSGVGQITAKYIPLNLAGTQLAFEVDVIGESNLRGVNDNLVTKIVGYRANQAMVGNKGLQVNLSADNDNPSLGKTFRVYAEPNHTSAQVPHLKYLWFVTGSDGPIPVNTAGSACTLVGFQNVLECTLQPGDTDEGKPINIFVSVIDEVTGEYAESLMDLPVGHVALLAANPSLVPQYPIDETGEHRAEPAGNPAEERWFEVKAEVVSAAQRLDYKWYVDQQLQESNCRKIPIPGFTGGLIPVRGPGQFHPEEDLEVCGRASKALYVHATKENSHTYEIELRLYDALDGIEYGKEKISVRTDPMPTPYSGTTSTSAELFTADESVPAGEEIEIQAINLETDLTNEYEYIWKVDGETVPRPENERLLAFHAMPEKEGYDVELDVIKRKEGNVIGKFSDNQYITVTETNAESDIYSRGQSVRASLSQKIQNPLIRSLGMIFLVFGCAIGVILITARKDKRGAGR